MQAEEQAAPGRRLGLALGGVSALTTLAWWTLTDRLDVLRLWLLVVGTALALGWWLWRGWRGQAGGLEAASAAPIAWVVVLAASAPAATLARVEGWAGWLAAGALVGLARRADGGAVAWVVGGAGIALAALAWAQALGAPLLNASLAGLGGRRVVGTLGGPAHLGWALAASLPWCVAALRGSVDAAGGASPDAASLVSAEAGGPGDWRRARRRVGLRAAAPWAAAALLFGAVALSGSRATWIATLVALPVWCPRRAWRRALLALVLGVGLAASVGAARGGAGLSARVAELSAPGSTARGRLYIWRVHLASVEGLPLTGLGPEGFARRWPMAQRAYLSRHPEAARFRSDLRHAHADAFEVYVDLGLLGLASLGWLLVVALRRRREGPVGRAGRAALIALLVIGLADAPLFFAPTLGLAALSVGVLLGPPSRRGGGRRWAAGALIALTLTLWPLTARLRSEVSRSQATAALDRARAPGEGRAAALARARARVAIARDPRNPRAWWTLGMACWSQRDVVCARQAFAEAARDLPAAAALLQALDAEDAPPAAPL